MSTASELASRSSAGTSDNTNREKFLTFCLGREEYGLPILVVREIIGMIDITPLPRTPGHVKGVINLRGKIIPVIELRAKFGLAPVPYTAETCIIVVEVDGGSAGMCQLGVVVDAVREVLDIARDHIEPPTGFGGAIPLSYILGLGKVKEKVVILLDINTVGAVSELQAAAAAGAASAQPARAAA